MAAACREPASPRADSTGAGQPTERLRIVATPATTTLRQVGLDLVVSLRDSATFTFQRLLVDSGTANERDESRPFDDRRFTSGQSLGLVAFAPSAGTHRITVIVTDAKGTVVTASITRTFDLPDVAYTATPLPDLGAGAGVRWVTAGGDVAGWVQRASGDVAPAVWSGGALRVVAVPGGNGAIALRVNAAGDVLFRYTAYASGAGGVVRADGTPILVDRIVRYPVAGGDSAWCCREPSDLTESRQALATTTYLPTTAFDQSAIVDVPTGRVTAVPGQRLLLLNRAGQGIGVRSTELQYQSLFLVAYGFPAPALPSGTKVGYCDTAGRWTTTVPVDLDEAGDVLASRCGGAAYLPFGGAPVWADRFVGRGEAHLSRQGGLVASLDESGSIFLWRIGATVSSRLRLPDDAWRIDSLAAVNGVGAIAAHGIERTTGRGAALLLTPVVP